MQEARDLGNPRVGFLVEVYHGGLEAQVGRASGVELEGGWGKLHDSG